MIYTKNTLKLLALLCLMQSQFSCSHIAEALDVKLENYPTDNIYRSVNMSLFHGFNDKVSISELEQQHGKPNHILDAKEVADVDGYNIWEYLVKDGAIDCYIKKNDSIVDYLYFEPSAKSIPFSSIIKDKDLEENIANDGAFADFLVDELKNTVRVLKTKDKNAVINIALNDNSELIGRESLKKQITNIQTSLPQPISDLGKIVNIELKDGTVYIVFSVHEFGNQNVNSLFANDRLSNAVGMQLFDNLGIFCHITPIIFEEHANIKLHFIGDRTKKVVRKDFKVGKALTLPTTNLKMLQANMDFANLAISPIVSESMSDIIPEKIEIVDNNLLITHTIKGEVLNNWKDLSEGNIGQVATGWLSDLNNPDWVMMLLAYKCGLGLNFSIIKGNMGDSFTTTFTNKQLFKMLSISKAQDNVDNE